ncbi:MAG TPA: cupin domain-containing protein [Chitinophagaceae bacterium]|jgi:(S)-ureidoglycine aminohydrolase|nr:cupin domain-containing protein [Chitinophagaceae bacterium]
MRTLLALLLQTIVMNTFAQLKPIPSGVYHWNELPVKKEAGREGRKIAEGTTNEFEYFEIHATTQYKGAVPRPPHAQEDIEEVIIIKEGTLKCTIGDKTAALGPGSVLLIPPHEMQTFENTGDGPVTYYVFMFRSKKAMNIERSTQAGGTLLLNHDSLLYKEANNKGTRKYFDRPTAMCENFEMHITYLKAKGPSHVPHQHADTEIILMIDGESEMTIGGKTYTAGPGDLYIAESNTMHGIGNATDKPCSYFAFKWR